MRHYDNERQAIVGPPPIASSRMSNDMKQQSGGILAPPVAPSPGAQRQPGLAKTIGTQYTKDKASGFLDDTVMPWMEEAGADALAYGKDALGMNVAGAAPGAVTSGVATGAEAGIANSLGTGIASGAGTTAATGAATGGAAAAAGGGAMAGLMAAAPYAAAAYGLYRLLK